MLRIKMGMGSRSQKQQLSHYGCYPCFVPFLSIAVHSMVIIRIAGVVSGIYKPIVMTAAPGAEKRTLALKVITTDGRGSDHDKEGPTLNPKP